MSDTGFADNDDFAPPVVTLPADEAPLTQAQAEAGLAEAPAAPVVVEPDGSPVPDLDPIPVPPADADADATPDAKPARARSERGALESQVEALVKKYDGTGVVLTPHKVAHLLAEDGVRDKAPSSGAVSAVFDRWKACGAATFSTKPYAFTEFTAAAKADGIAACKAAHKAANKSE